MPLVLDALTAPVRAADVRAYDESVGGSFGRQWRTTAVVLLVFLVGQATLIVVFFRELAPHDPVWRAVPPVWIALSGVYAVGLILLIRRRIVRTVRLWRAASANGLSYAERSALARSAGAPVRGPGHLGARDVLSQESQLGRVGFTAASVPRSAGLVSRQAGMLEVALDRRVPHIVLENPRVRVMRASGRRPVRTQRLKLEGDFDRTFALYCAEGYERDALYIFTPDLMALLLDVAGDCEVEFVDDHVLLYARRTWKLWRPERFAAVVGLAGVVGGTARRRTELYRDERSLAAGVVAASGRSVRMRPTVGTVLTVGAMVAVTMLGVVTVLAGW